MEKRRKLNVELIKFHHRFHAGGWGFKCFLEALIVNNRQYRKLYNDKALEIAKTVSDQVKWGFYRRTV